MTFLEAINAVLRRLREDEVTGSGDTAYSKLIGDFVNQAIYDCERAWDWNSLKEVATVTVVATIDTYPLIALADIGGLNILSAINDTKNWTLRTIPAELQHKYDYLDSAQSGSPYYYSYQGYTSGANTVKFYPTPDALETMRFLVVKYSPERDLDGSDDTETINIPTLPVILNAYARAVSERGEDGGIGINEANREAASALADAIGVDAAQNHPCEVVWNAI